MIKVDQGWLRVSASFEAISRPFTVKQFVPVYIKNVSNIYWIKLFYNEWPNDGLKQGLNM
jgi:hypothetical protein